MTEADTCRELVTPKLVAAGWGASESVIGEQHSFTSDRIVAGGKVRRGKQRRADYLLYYRRDMPLAVVEAKEVGLPAETGVPPGRTWREVNANIFSVVNGKKIPFENADGLFRQLRAAEPSVALIREAVALSMTADEIHEDVYEFIAKMRAMTRQQ